MTIQAIVFDFHGVLASINHRAAAIFLSPLLPFPLTQLAARWERWLSSPASRQGPDGAMWSSFLRSLCVELDLSEDTHRMLHAFNYLSLLSPFPDAVDALRLARAKGIKVGVLSNTPLVDSLESMQAIGIAELIDVAMNPEVLGTSKPDAAAYHGILTAMGVTPHKSLFFDDDPRHVAGAAAVGMNAFFVDRSRTCHALSENVVADLSATTLILATAASKGQ